MQRKQSATSAVDLFCGIGGLSLGLKQAGIEVVAGVDIDPMCEFGFTENIGAPYILKSVADITAADLEQLWVKGSAKLLAGCAPCQPFSSHRRGLDTSSDEKWSLLAHFKRLVSEVRPEYVTMENVPRLKSASVFAEFVSQLKVDGYWVAFDVLNAIDYGLPQSRKRLVLIASRLGEVRLPQPSENRVTVKDVFKGLPEVAAGEGCDSDPLHVTQRLTEVNVRRIRASIPGGTWRDWDADIRLKCHQKDSGKYYSSVYGRMEFDKPSPTITTQFFNYGTGRFGHPKEDRALTLREGALLQGFPIDYKFAPSGSKVSLAAIGRLIGNAVPPPLAKAVAASLLCSS